MRLNPKLALVVEDDALQRVALSEFLSDRDVDVVHCESAEAGKFVIMSMGPELSVLITDVVLEGQNSGLKLARFARDCLPDLKIVIVSGKTMVELPSDFHVLRKPWLPADLLRLSPV